MQERNFYQEEIAKMQDYLTRLGYASETIQGYINSLNYFFNWVCKTNFYLINQETLECYNHHLHSRPISRKTIQSKLGIIKLYDQYLQKVENRKIITKPLEVLETEIERKPDILTQKEIKKLYLETEDTLKGYLERAILALYYGCGLRSKEGLRLELKDINYETNLIHIKPGKNYRNRFIPMSKRVKNDLLKYIKYCRKHLIGVETNRLLINTAGIEMKKGYARKVIKRLSKSAGIEKSVTLHMLRHSIATHLLQQGMKLESISQFLGHKSIQTTQKYTHLKNEI